MTIKKVTDLVLWQKAMDFTVAVYTSSQRFPRSEAYGLTKQIRSAAVSISSNIAEGYEQLTTGNYIRFLGIAKGSLGEVETQIYLARRLNYLDLQSTERLFEQSTEIGRLLNGLLRSLRKSDLPRH